MRRDKEKEREREQRQKEQFEFATQYVSNELRTDHAGRQGSWCGGDNEIMESFDDDISSI